MTKPEGSGQLSPDEAAKRRDDALRRALATPPKPQEEMKLGKRKGARQTGAPERKKREGGPRREDRPGLEEEKAP